MELVDLVNVDTVHVVVVRWENCVDVFLERQDLVDRLHGIAPMAGRHDQRSRYARDLGEHWVAGNVHDCISHHDRTRRDVEVGRRSYFFLLIKTNSNG